MNMVVISAGTPREKWAVYQVIKNFPNVTVIHHVSQNGLPKGSKSKENFSDFLGKKLINFLRKRTIEKITQDVSLDPSSYKKIEFDQGKLKTDEGFYLVASLKPDIIVTCKAPVLRERILQIPTFGCINVH